jgi:hypothetical protein
MNTVKALSKAIEAKDPYTQGHVDRVAKYGLAIALELDSELIKDDMFRYALVLHDIGKIQIPDAILAKKASFQKKSRISSGVTLKPEPRSWNLSNSCRKLPKWSSSTRNTGTERVIPMV